MSTKKSDARAPAHLPKPKPVPGCTKAWTEADDAVLIAGYRDRGLSWCREQLPHRSALAIQQRAYKVGASRSVREVAEIRKAERSNRESQRQKQGEPTWRVPEPRYASVWAMAQGVTA